MKRIFSVISVIFALNLIFAQIENNVYKLNPMNSLLTNDVKKVLDENLSNKKIVFLGESGHFIGSDFLAKTEFVKYLVLEKGYKDIAFEADFFALYFNHDKQNLYPFWYNSVQCRELFDFLKINNVTIWGFDNQLYSKYTRDNFVIKLNEFLNNSSMNIDEDFIKSINKFFDNPVKSNQELGEKIIQQIETLLKCNLIINNRFWVNSLESLKTFVIINSNHLKREVGSPIRDNQMAKNLDFLVNSMYEKKFIVWLHNAHMTKHDYTFVPGENMGGEFVKLNPNISYHIAFSAINLFLQSSKKIEKYSKNKDNLLHFLPSTENNYFIDSHKITIENPIYKEKQFDGLFDYTSKNTKTNWLGHYDALVFISKGELVKEIK